MKKTVRAFGKDRLIIKNLFDYEKRNKTFYAKETRFIYEGETTKKKNSTTSGQFP